jgi:hypothetical protein
MTMAARRGMVLFSIVAAPLLSTCGSSGGGSCGKVAPCGGDIVGSWTITGACVNNGAVTMQIAQLLPGCTTATGSVSNVHATGSASFNTDMTYTLTETLSASGQATIPPSCLQVSGFSITCADADLLLQQVIVTMPTGIQSAHCSGSSSCVCDFTLSPTTTNETGTYTTTGTTLATTADTGTVNSIDYCVQKNALHMVAVDTTMPMGPMGQVNIDADTVFKKQ